jgi:hypothetical protein
MSSIDKGKEKRTGGWTLGNVVVLLLIVFVLFSFYRIIAGGFTLEAVKAEFSGNALWVKLIGIIAAASGTWIYYNLLQMHKRNKSRKLKNRASLN